MSTEHISEIIPLDSQRQLNFRQTIHARRNLIREHMAGRLSQGDLYTFLLAYPIFSLSEQIIYRRTPALVSSQQPLPFRTREPQQNGH